MQRAIQCEGYVNTYEQGFFFYRVSLTMNEYTYCNSISYINIIEEAIKLSVRKKKLNLYGYPSEISIADFGYIPYLGNDKASRKSFNA